MQRAQRGREEGDGWEPQISQMDTDRGAALSYDQVVGMGEGAVVRRFRRWTQIWVVRR